MLKFKDHEFRNKEFQKLYRPLETVTKNKGFVRIVQTLVPLNWKLPTNLIYKNELLNFSPYKALYIKFKEWHSFCHVIFKILGNSCILRICFPFFAK